MARDSTTTFLHLPVEVRLQIYHLALSPSRLCVRPILDPEWLFAPDRGCRVAALLFASKSIYAEAAPVFYSKATLELTPCQRDPTDARQLHEFFGQYEEDHAFCPPEYLRLIQNAHIYGDQAWPVDQDSFQALFQWLVLKTRVRHIYLSRKTMQQGKHIPELICLNNLVYDANSQLDDPRIIDVYARSVSSRLRFIEGQNGLHNRAKPWPDVQLYFSLPLGPQLRLCREPRWDLVSTNSDKTSSKEELLRRHMQRFASGDLGDAFLRQAHMDGYLWLYATIQIQRTAMTVIFPAASTTNAMDRDNVLAC